jgi:hypothetical protein
MTRKRGIFGVMARYKRMWTQLPSATALMVYSASIFSAGTNFAAELQTTTS